MKRVKLLFLLLAYLLPASHCLSQDVPLGAWKDYLSYQDGLTVCQGGSNIYCCCPSGVFAYNLSDNSLTRYNKVTGLSDIGCTVARYNNLTSTLVIGYSDGNIDLVTPSQVINLSDLKNTITPGSKTINNIYFSTVSPNLAYLSCAQGIIVVDLYQDIIQGEYIIGPLGTALNVYSTTIFTNDTLYAATENGIYKISVNDPNPQDYQDWQKVSQRLPLGPYNAIVTCGNRMYASFANHLTNPSSPPYNKDTLFTFNLNPDKWSLDTNAPLQSNGKHDTNGIRDNIYSLESSSIKNVPYLLYSGNGNVTVYDTSGNIYVHVYNYGAEFLDPPSTNDAILDNNGNQWIADGNYGLIETPGNFSAQSFYPPGPFSNSIFDMQANGSNLYIAPGGYTQGYVPEFTRGVGVSAYSGDSWYRLIENANPDTIFNLCNIAIDPNNPLHACAGSYDNGIVEYNNYAITNVYGPYNSTLSNYYPSPSSGYWSVRIGGVGFDTNSNLWAANSDANFNYLDVKKSNGTWQTFYFNQVPNVPNGAILSKLLVTKSGAKWMIFPGIGILAYQDNGTFASPTANNSVFINDAVNNGDLPSLNIYCMTEDQNGAIWVGTDTRVVVFYSPDNIYNGPGGWDAQNVYVQQTGYTQYLMQNQYTTAIAVDGANRKWIGTLGGGVFLMSADGTQQLLNFTSSNSPLLSNNILCITINQITGEVFFGTDQGLVSYRGTGTEGGSTFSNVYAYPDPVPHGYNGPIAIKNLVANSDVKIATVNGEIVYHTTALGGQAVWYGTNFNGVRVQTGIYLVFCTSPDGTQSIVTKLLLEN